jgi:hypothetical protein
MLLCPASPMAAKLIFCYRLITALPRLKEKGTMQKLKIKSRTHAAFIALLLIAAFFGLNAGPAHAQSSDGTRFKGNVAQSRFEMTLRREGDKLEGSYFYAKSGAANRLSLRGTIDANGQFTLQEFDAGGKQTGEFKGTWKDDPNQSGATLDGEWRKPGDKEPQYFSASEQIISFTNGTQIVDRQIKESVKAKRLDLFAEYPELTGSTSAAAFNQLVKARITKELADFRKQMMSITAADLKMLPEGMNNYIDIGYSVEYADNDLISVNFLEGTFTGGVHPNYNYFTVTYDLKNGRELKLSELFKPGAKYLEAISAYAIKDLQSRKMPDSDENMGLAQDVFADGAKPAAENYQNWNITKKGLMFTFDPYQVGPYAVGSQTVIVPYARLKEIVRTGSALTKIMQ